MSHILHAARLAALLSESASEYTAQHIASKFRRVTQLPPSEVVIEALVDLSSGPKPAVVEWKEVCTLAAELTCPGDTVLGALSYVPGPTDPEPPLAT